jgi:hypothetical protein
MDEQAKRIFDASSRVISKLQLLSVFFGDEMIFKIYVRSQVIHKLFETTPELDIHKLDLYHLQFTESIVELLRKIKKTNEKNVMLLFDEIHFNEVLIEKFRHELEAADTYEAERARQAARINDSIFRLYQNLSDHARDNPFAPAIYEFSARYAKDYFHEITEAQLDTFTQYSLEEEYKNGYGIIDKKLMGQQCRHGFSNEFVCGLKAGNETLEIYKMTARDTYFLFYPRRNFYNDFDIAHLAHLSLTPPQSARAKMVQDLKEKNHQLKASEDKVRTAISPEIKELLNNYYNRISALNFLDTSDHEVQANILRAMLNTDGL